MSIDLWWLKLGQQSRDYLIANNGDVVPPDLVDEISRAGGTIRADAWWVGQSGPEGLLLSDEAIDWIDEVPNGERPEPRAEDRNPAPETAALCGGSLGLGLRITTAPNCRSP